VKKHVPIYRLKVRYKAPSGKKWEDKEIEGRFTQWFNEAGYLQHAELEKWLADNIEVIGMAGSQNTKRVKDRDSGDRVKTAAEFPRSSGLDTPSSAKATKKSKRKA
jgi:Microsomal signal peptidase 25 kDa subunit (SPC25)